MWTATSRSRTEWGSGGCWQEVNRRAVGVCTRAGAGDCLAEAARRRLADDGERPRCWLATEAMRVQPRMPAAGCVRRRRPVAGGPWVHATVAANSRRRSDTTPARGARGLRQPPAGLPSLAHLSAACVEPSYSYSSMATPATTPLRSRAGANGHVAAAGVSARSASATKAGDGAGARCVPRWRCAPARSARGSW